MSALLVHQYSQSVLASFPDLIDGVAGVIPGVPKKSTLLEIYLAITKLDVSAEHALVVGDTSKFQVKCFKYICSLLGVKGCICDEILKVFDDCVATTICSKLFGCCLSGQQ